MTTLKPPFQAEDMQGLYKKIIKGVYPKIPEHFSSDLNIMLEAMIRVDSKRRLNCAEIIDHPVFKKRSLKYFPELFENNKYKVENDTKSILLKTIKIPKNIMNLSNRLPRKNYLVQEMSARNNQSYQ